MMLCHVILPNFSVQEVEVDPKADGQDCFDQVCQRLGIVEQDYFGLQFRGSKGENLWLNLRNRINRQLFGTQPFRLQLRVKFFVQPHNLLQAVTRDLFYHQVKHELYSGKLVTENLEQTVRFVGLIAQAEHGPYHNNRLQLNLYKTLLDSLAESSSETIQAIADEHIKCHELSAEHAKYRLLQEASNLQNYGMEYHKGRNCAGDIVSIGICPTGVFQFDTHLEQVDQIEYPAILKATQSERNCVLNIMDDEGDVHEVVFRLSSVKTASAMYRSVTEMHSFFRCDTVHNAVSNQFSRDLKGTLASLFNENSTLGREYVFDIKRTCREALDHARRELYRPQDTAGTDPGVEEMEDECNANCDSRQDEGMQYQDLQERLERYQESMLCCVCKDAEISTALVPCGHVTCCTECASRLMECPLCRKSIDHVQKIYLPLLRATQCES